MSTAGGDLHEHVAYDVAARVGHVEAARERGAGRQAVRRELDAVDDQPLRQADARGRNRGLAVRRLIAPCGPGCATAAVCAERRRARAGRVRRGHDDADASSRDPLLRRCTSCGCAGDRSAAVALRVAAVPLVRVRRRRVARPGAVARGQRRADLWRAADRRRCGVHRRVIRLCGQPAAKPVPATAGESRDERGDCRRSRRESGKVLRAIESPVSLSLTTRNCPSRGGRNPINRTLTALLTRASLLL